MRIFSPAIAPTGPLPVSINRCSTYSSYALCSSPLLTALRRDSLGAEGSRRQPFRQAPRSPWHPSELLLDLDNPTSPNGPPALANSEAQAFLHGDRLDQLHLHLGVVTWQHHLGAFRQVHHTGHVGSAEVELRTVVVEERGVPPALVL